MLIENIRSRSQVETIGDAYMIVSGVPERIAYHGERVADMALAMLSEATGIAEPGNLDDHLKIRIGKIHLLYRKKIEFLVFKIVQSLILQNERRFLSPIIFHKGVR